MQKVQEAYDPEDYVPLDEGADGGQWEEQGDYYPEDDGFPKGEEAPDHNEGELDTGRPRAVKLFLGGISPRSTSESIAAHFGAYGELLDAVAMRDKDGTPRKFGFVTFRDPEAAEAVLRDVQTLDGHSVEVKRAAPLGEAPPPKEKRSLGPRTDKIFIGGLGETTYERLVEYFSRYGVIIDAVVMRNRETGRSRGFGFVQFNSTEPVERVMRELERHKIDGRHVEVKKSVPRDGASMLPPPRRARSPMARYGSPSHLAGRGYDGGFSRPGYAYGGKGYNGGCGRAGHPGYGHDPGYARAGCGRATGGFPARGYSASGCGAALGYRRSLPPAAFSRPGYGYDAGPGYGPRDYGGVRAGCGGAYPLANGRYAGGLGSRGGCPARGRDSGFHRAGPY